MKTIRKLLLMLILVASVSVYGQEHISPVPIDGFWGINLPCSKQELMKALKEKGYDDHDISYDRQNKAYSIYYPTLAGFDFDIASFRMYNDETMYYGQFSTGFDKDQDLEALVYLDDIFKIVTSKYKAPNPVNHEAYILFYAWVDRDENLIVLTLQESLSQRGKERYYIKLEYYNNEYDNKERERIENEI